MKIGLYGINIGPCAEPETLAEAVKRAEQAGLDSVWTAEHVVLPDPQVPPSPSPPQMKLLDPAVALGFAAAHSTRLKLATGIVILPQRNPVVAAKEFASVDRLSKGRLIFGVAAGYLHQEFAAVGVPFEKLHAHPATKAKPGFETSMSPLGLPDADLVARYADLGLDRLVVTPFARTADDLWRAIDHAQQFA